MFIGATAVALAKAPLDASSVAIQVAIKQQREFEDALRVAQERRELEQASEQARLEERQKREVVLSRKTQLAHQLNYWFHYLFDKILEHKLKKSLEFNHDNKRTTK